MMKYNLCKIKFIIRQYFFPYFFIIFKKLVLNFILFEI